ncbi:hypothetical protein BC833DRAFT_591707 [Globomyces pollinis-pini]|nr:hypothetical protein BC833DRAFT_591707 [Globomyces pollinis-pini]
MPAVNMVVCEPSYSRRPFNFEKPTKDSKTELKRHNSMEEVAETMESMDKLNDTSFSTWIRSESNVAYICSIKGELILSYIDKDPESALYALQWMTQDWSLESVAELVLKLFYSTKMNSKLFSNRLYGIVSNWPREKVYDLLPILLIGETPEVCAAFFSEWLKLTNWTSDTMADCIIPLVVGYQWNTEDLSNFLLNFTLATCVDEIVQKSLMLVIHDEMQNIEMDMVKSSSRKHVCDTFEMLLQIIVEERNEIRSIEL